MKRETANKILHDTEIGYDSISKKFSETRKHFWRGLEYLKDYTSEGSNILDYGCGNGRLLELIGDVPNFQYYGLDTSQELINLANQRYSSSGRHFSKLNPSQTSLPQADTNFKTSDNTNGEIAKDVADNKRSQSVGGLAFEDNFFNTIYSIAVFHHFPSKAYREQIAAELYRTTSNNGKIIVTVWYLWQKKYFKNILANWLDKIKGNSQLDWNDCLISFTNNEGKRFQRFHHAFNRRELKNLFEDVGFKIEKCEIVGGRNIVLIAHK